ncbi:hypothetical protein GGR57DRAFT_78857 [Xylariaceae sp. FL1272]|nr:hypothetical protein GGR57DRAFT_78857 [Xylariaceae sp. FL1272]
MSGVVDDIDAITPCPIETNVPPPPPPQAAAGTIDDIHATRSASPSSVCSSFVTIRENNGRRRESIKALEEETGGDPERLWKRMLALHRRYRCYNSARMSAALSSGDISVLRPSKACLDLLNEHMELPDESECDSDSASVGPRSS